ncbi:TIR domain-containing protein [Sphingomicrobium flavum]|uniref:TIR domain-containing protein n=1 Tax=Sphingomicrobium flavum TaxID=1229164 RepID=UPI0021ADA0F7|nr:TIR domain-containing protein [Sphingomicrobium flavum]
MGDRQYKAFLSYSHRDKAVAEWLHRQLETYRLPQSLVDEGAPKRLAPIFKDREELPVTDDLGDAIKEALANSEALIVLCSPHSAISPWIGREIDIFKRMHGDKNVYPVVVDGDPPHNVPLPLRTHYEDGAPTEEMAEPVAADFRPEADGKKLGLMKLIAGLAGVQLDALVDREAARKHKRALVVAGLSILGMVIAVGLALFALQQRDAARAERTEANGLIEYMLTDLREQLEPVGRLDILGGVGSRAMEYYARQNLDSLSPEELGRRAKAIQLVAEVHNERGDNEKALPAFREAARTTGELLARKPDDPERMFNHGQSLFWVGLVALQHAQTDEAKEAMQGYADISTRLAAKDRTNLEWQMEEGYAYSNLGTMADEDGNYAEALALFERSVAVIERVTKAEGRPPARLIEIGTGLSWVSSMQQRLGDYAAAQKTRAREIALYEEVLEQQPDHFGALRFNVFAQGQMGHILAMRGRKDAARTILSAAIDDAERLIRRDPDNTSSLTMSIGPFNEMALLDWAEGRSAKASEGFDRIAALIENLAARDANNRDWNIYRPARLALERALTDRSSAPPDQLKSMALDWRGKIDADSPDHVWLFIASHLVEGIALERSGDGAAASAAFARALAVEDQAQGVSIANQALRAVAAQKLGQAALARQLRKALADRGLDPLIDDRL